MTESSDSLLIRSADRQAWCRITYRDEADGSVVVDIEVDAYGFTESSEDISFQNDALIQFTAELVDLEKKRGGKAVFYNTGVADATNYFCFELNAVSAAARVIVRRNKLVASKTYALLGADIAFEFDGGDLLTLVRDWQRLFQRKESA